MQQPGRGFRAYWLAVLVNYVEYRSIIAMNDVEIREYSVPLSTTSLTDAFIVPAMKPIKLKTTKPAKIPVK